MGIDGRSGFAGFSLRQQRIGTRRDLTYSRRAPLGGYGGTAIILEGLSEIISRNLPGCDDARHYG